MTKISNKPIYSELRTVKAQYLFIKGTFERIDNLKEDTFWYQVGWNRGINLSSLYGNEGFFYFCKYV